MVSHCACPTRVFGDRALHEHRRASSLPSHAPSKLARTFFSRGGLDLSPIARIDRAHSVCAALRHTDAPPKLARFSPPGDCLVGVPLRASNRNMNDPSKLARFLLRGRLGLVSNCARRTTTASSWGFREHGEPTRPPPLYVSIISNRASNSCPQAVQRMQSDSTVNSSDLIPMPPQSGQRASWIF